ncbi:5717_t:CDS:2, partial [Funneliformis geosporum]
EQVSLNQDQESIPKELSDTGCSASEKILVISNPVIEISADIDGQSQKYILGSSNDILSQ